MKQLVTQVVTSSSAPESKTKVETGANGTLMMIHIIKEMKMKQSQKEKVTTIWSIMKLLRIILTGRKNLRDGDGNEEEETNDVKITLLSFFFDLMKDNFLFKILLSPRSECSQ